MGTPARALFSKVCCSVLQRVAACCSNCVNDKVCRVIQWVHVSGSYPIRCLAFHRNLLQCVTVCVVVKMTRSAGLFHGYTCRELSAQETYKYRALWQNKSTTAGRVDKRTLLQRVSFGKRAPRQQGTSCERGIQQQG